jgi:hypothetical protein
MPMQARNQHGCVAEKANRRFDRPRERRNHDQVRVELRSSKACRRDLRDPERRRERVKCNGSTPFTSKIALKVDWPCLIK